MLHCHRLLGLPLLTLLISQASAYTIPKVGAPREQVIQSLGHPIGSIELRDKELLLFPQGDITIQSGIASSVDIMTPEAFEADQARLAEERAEWERSHARMLEARKAAGIALKEEKLNSLRFQSLPPADQVTYWRNFQASYPAVDVSDVLAEAIEAHKAEMAALREQQAIAQLEDRVAQAEKEAQEAKAEAERLKRQMQSRSYYGLRYYRTPRKEKAYYYKPPTVTIHTSDSGEVKVYQDGHWHLKSDQQSPSQTPETERKAHWRDSVWIYEN